MIQFFGTRDHVDTVNQYADSWAPELRAHIRTVAYENVPFRDPVPGGVCIFMDFERLLPLEMSLARRLAATVRALPEKYVVLNEPARYLGRLRLLEVLHERGINEFRAFRPGALPDGLRFPVFLRSEIDHEGPATPLLHTPGELKSALARDVFQDRLSQKHLLVTEFCDCQDADGFFRKYSVMCIGGVLIPRHLFFSRHWVQKHADLVDATNLVEEERFMKRCSHTAEVLAIFKLAGVDYGRIDYSLLHGRIQVWEINTNPTVVPRREQIHPLRLPHQFASARHIAAVLQNLSAGHDSPPAYPFRSATLWPARVLQYFSRRGQRQHRK